MRTKQKPKSDFLTDSRRSIQKDFQRYSQREKTPKIEDSPKINAERRIAFVGEKSEYFRFRSFIVGKKVRLIRESVVGGGWVCEFIHDDDRKALNRAGGWSDNKKQYLFDCVKFK